MTSESGIIRFFYGVLLFLLLAGCFPIILILSFVLLIVQGPPVLFRQRRIGKNGRPFTIVKFRTMGIGAEKQQRSYTKMNEAHGPVFKITNDPRYTRIGKMLAHTGLDELPQLWNVVRGDMALFGPRPLPVAEEKKLKPWQKERDRIKPGIFSPWILQGYHQTSFDAWMKSDIAYIQQKSTWYDILLTAHAIRYMWVLLVREFIG